MKIQRSSIEAAATSFTGMDVPFASPHHFQTNSKGFGNINLSVDEVGDIFAVGVMMD
jgi:hypothetical protein